MANLRHKVRGASSVRPPTGPSPSVTAERYPASPARLGRTEWLAPALAVCLALGSCLFHLGGRSIWNDEAVSLRIARTPGWDVILSDGGNMAVYYLFLRWWLRLGDTLWMARLPSALFAAGGVALLYLLARRLINPRIAAVSAVLLAANSSFVYYGQEARSYALALMLTVASWLAFAAGLERRSLLWFVLWGGMSALAVGTHLFTVLIVAAQVLSLILLPRRAIPWMSLLAGAAVAAVGSAPFLLAAVNRGSVQIDWIPPASVTAIRQVLWFLGGNNFEPTIEPVPRLLGVVVLVVCLTSWAAGIWLAVAAFRKGGRSPETWRYGVPALWLTVPLAGAGAASATVQPLLVPRFFIACLPASCLLFALGLSRIRRPRDAALGLGFLLVLSAVGVVRSYGTGNWGWDRASAVLVESARPGDAVVILPSHQRLSVDYYLKRDPAGRSLEVLSPMQAPWRHPEPTVYGVSEAFFAPAPPGEAARRAASRRRVWVLTSDYTRWDGSGRVREALAEARQFFELLGPDFRVTEGRAVGRVGVLLVEKRPDSAAD